MRAYRTEVKLNNKQKHLYRLNISACRLVYNLFISTNQERYKNNEKYLNNCDFSRWFNNKYIFNNPDKQWLKEASSKAVRNTIDNCNRAYLKAFRNKKGFPKFKKASTDKTGYYFTRNPKVYCCRHKIKVPCLGWITLKEEGYIPFENIISGSITKRADRYFVSVIVDENSAKDNRNQNEGIGIDLGVKTFMSCSNGLEFFNINKTNRIKRLEKKLKREQRALSRKFEANKKREVKCYKNIEKNKLKVERSHFKLECIRNAYINKCVDIVIENKPNFITIENLNISGMLKNRHLSKAIKDSKFYYTKQVILQKAIKHNIEVREVSRFYPSSKKCSCCGKLDKNLTLKNRTYKCSCGLEMGRDLNASINLRDCKEYKILNNVKNTDGLSGINACGVLQQTIVASNSKIEHDETRKSIEYIINKMIDITKDLVYTKVVSGYIL